MKTDNHLASFIKINKVSVITGAAFALIHILFMFRVANPPSADAQAQLNFLVMFVDFPVMCVFELGTRILGGGSPEAMFIFVGIFGTIFYFLIGCLLGLFWQWGLAQTQKYDQDR